MTFELVMLAHLCIMSPFVIYFKIRDLAFVCVSFELKGVLDSQGSNEAEVPDLA